MQPDSLGCMRIDRTLGKNWLAKSNPYNKFARHQ